MSPDWVRELAQALPGRVRAQAGLAPHTTYRIGGPADALVEPAGAEDVQRTLEVARRHGIPWTVLGLGSNVLVADTGIRGVVLRMGKRMGETRGGDGPCPEVDAGVPTPLLARRTAHAGYAGVHRLVGVPGTVGGGVYMNAGAHGQEFRQVVRTVRLVTAAGEVEERAAVGIPWAYRSSGLGAVVVLGATLALEPADPERLGREIREHLRWRKAGTPYSEPCCGSVFRNPGEAAAATGPDGPRTAGQLIDAAGLKGYGVGGARVSPMHANYIVNTGGATASDVRQVIADVRHRVLDRFGVTLELEVRLLGFDDT